MKKTLLILCALLLTAVGANAQTAYKFVCTDWVSLDQNRATASDIKYDESANTITVTKDGNCNIALGNSTSYGESGPITTAEMYITSEQKYFVVIGSNLNTSYSDNTYSQLWWMNGAGGPTAKPDYVVELTDETTGEATGETLFAWDLSTIDAFSSVLTPDNDGHITLNGWTGFGLTSTTGTSVISDICFYTTAEAIAAYPSLDGVLHDATPYEFLNTDWVELTDHPYSTATASDNNTITITTTANSTTSIGLCNGNEAPYNTAGYYVTNEQSWFVIVGTNLSTAESASILWWMNGYNEGMTIAPTETATLEDGQIALAWDLSQSVAGTYLQNEKNTLSGFTCFGLTSTSTTTVISDICYYTFDEMVEVYPELDQRTPYEFVNSDWVILSDHTDATAVANNDNTISITTTANSTTSMGITNGNNPYTTANYYVTNEQCWFIVVGTNLSTAEGASELWWMDGANWGSWAPTAVKELSDGQVLVAWDLSTMTEIDVNLQNEKNTLSGWTCFGLTSTTGTSVISDINFYTEDEAHSMIDGTSHFCTANESHWTLTQSEGGNGVLQLDTWANQNDEDMSVPFMEYYVAEGQNKDVTLSAATISHETLTGLAAGVYEVSMDIRIIEYDTGSINDGTKFKANDVEEDLLDGLDANDGTYGEDTDAPEDLFGTYTLYVEVAEGGTIDISLVIPEGANYSWIMWKNLTVKNLGTDATPVTVSGTMGAEYGTLILPFDVDAKDIPSGITAYTAGSVTTETDGESVLTLTAVEGELKAGTPYIIGGTSGDSYSFSGVPTKYEVSYSDEAGLLTGTLVNMTQDDFTADAGQYVLQNHTEEEGYSEDSEAGYGLGFYPITSSSSGVTLDAYHCYLTLDSGASPVRGFISFPSTDDEATRIVAVESEEDAEGNGAIYDLSGRKVSKAVKGVYIQNGKKVLVK